MRRAPPSSGIVWVLACAACAAGCRAPLDRAASSAAVVSVPGEPGTPALPEAHGAFFQGLADVASPLARLRAEATPAGAPLRLRSLPDVEEAVARRYARGAPGGALREALALGVSAHAPLPPRRMADLLVNAEAERQAFGAETFRAVGEDYRTPVATRRTYVVELLDRGMGPVRFDFRFALGLERWDLADGTVLLRYDPAPWAATEHISLFRGVAVLEPAPGGCVVTEMMIFGSDVRVPFFLRGTLRDLTVDVFRHRLERLWRLAAGLGR